ncbi:MAG TPA: 30S ribosome-binding factor RbfA [Candidatus Pacearchaeota archaeon]|nr:30S ribosome-binding factor RbfA [Candidatus Pacearchaeota archaeon]HQQ38500.1 30S ribosome-binding factor RbfA [bacterium]
MSWRPERLAREISEQVAVIVNQQEWPAERLTISSVVVSPKLDYARIYIAVWPKTAETETLKELNRRQGLIKKELTGKLRIRLMPEIGFYLDRSSEAVVRIAELLRKAEQDFD